MMSVEAVDGPQCRVGLAPTVSLVWPAIVVSGVLGQAAMVVACLASGAVGGDQRVPTRCRW